MTGNMMNGLVGALIFAFEVAACGALIVFIYIYLTTKKKQGPELPKQEALLGKSDSDKTAILEAAWSVAEKKMANYSYSLAIRPPWTRPVTMDEAQKASRIGAIVVSPFVLLVILLVTYHGLRSLSQALLATALSACLLAFVLYKANLALPKGEPVTLSSVAEEYLQKMRDSTYAKAKKRMERQAKYAQFEAGIAPFKPFLTAFLFALVVGSLLFCATLISLSRY